MKLSALLLDAVVWVILAFIIVPLVVVLAMAFSTTDYLAFPPHGFTLRWFGSFFSDPEWMGATQFSATIAVLVSLLTCCLGTMTSYALVRGMRRIGTLLQVLLIGPLIVPHIALAVALSLFFDRIGLSGGILGYVLAHTVIALPFAIFTVTAALAKVNPALEDAAMSCGARRFTAFRLITLPLIVPNILSAGLFAFIISFDEPVLAFFLAGIRNKTLPRMMFDNIEQNLTPVIPAVAVLLTGLSLVVLICVGLLRRRDTGQVPS